MTIYVFRLELVDESRFGHEYDNALVDQYDGIDNADCLRWFGEHYDINDFCASFCED